jgi:phosphatidylglycerol:prolipoprotein diacylglycerol transferase
VQLYEAAVNLLVYALLVTVYWRRPRAGLCAALYLVFYPRTRFMLEFLRGDPRMREWGLSVAQWISIALFAVGVISLAVLARPAGIQKNEPA